MNNKGFEVLATYKDLDLEKNEKWEEHLKRRR